MVAVDPSLLAAMVVWPGAPAYWTGAGAILGAALTVWVWCMLRSRQPDQEPGQTQMEEALKESEALFRQVWERSNDGMRLTDAEGVMVMVNDAFCRLVGKARRELAGKPLTEIYAEPAREHILATHRQRVAERSVAARLEREQAMWDGRKVWFEMSNSMLEIPGKPPLVLGILRDATRRKRNEEELEAARLEAERMNHELRTANQSLEQATQLSREMAARAESASAAKSEFLANMSHEIRTPLNAVLAFAEQLEEAELAPEQREYLLLLRSSAERLHDLLNDVLDYSKIEAGRLKLSEQPFDLREQLDKTLEPLAADGARKGLRVSLDVAPEVPREVSGDARRLHQVLVNLIANAIKFTERGEIKVRASSAPSGNGSRVVRFSIRDTGIGIPADKQAVIFEPFCQVDGSSTRNYGGTGLGLSISSRLVEMMGGKLSVVSEPGLGSTFTFETRFRTPNDGKLGEQGGAEAAVEGSKPPGGRSLRILLAEDNAINQKVACRWLEKEGHRVEVCGNGNEVLGALEAGSFDLVLMDVQMPDMDGLEATEEIRRREGSNGRHMPIIAVTAHAMRGDRERCLAAGMDDYLSKPVQGAQLLEAIERVISESDEKRGNSMDFQGQLASLNRALALERVGGDLTLLQEIARLFLEEGPSLVADLRRAAEARDAAELERVAHTLKGAVGNFTSEGPYQTALRLEMMGRQRSTDGAPEICQELEHQFEGLRSDLLALCAES